MWVKNYMFPNVCTVKGNITVKEAVKMMVEKKTNSLIIIDDENHPIGTVSSLKLINEAVPGYLKDDVVSSNFGVEGTFNKYTKAIADKLVKDVMYDDTHILSEDDTIIEAAAYTIDTNRRILPVANKEGVLIGAVTRTCIKNALYNVLFPDQPVKQNKGDHCCRLGRCQNKK